LKLYYDDEIDPKNCLTVKGTKTSEKEEGTKGGSMCLFCSIILIFTILLPPKVRYTVCVYIYLKTTHTHSKECIQEIV